jgi:hypothetical protein
VFHAESDPEGSWVAFSGDIGDPRLSSAFLHRPSDGQFVAVDMTVTPAFSPDGAWAAVVRSGSAAPGGPGRALALVDLRQPHAEARVVVPAAELNRRSNPRLLFSPDGRFLLVSELQRLALYTVPSGRRLWAAEAGDGAWSLGRFRGDEVVASLHRGRAAELSFETVRMATRADATPQLSADDPALRGQAGPSGTILARTAETFELREAKSGALVRRLDASPLLGEAAFLADGRIAALHDGGAGPEIRLFGSSGTEEGRIQLGPAFYGRLAGEAGRGWLVVVDHRRSDGNTRGVPGSVVLVDLGTGTVRREPGLYPVLGPRGDHLPAVPVFLDAERRVVRLDLATGAREVLIGSR